MDFLEQLAALDPDTVTSEPEGITYAQDVQQEEVVEALTDTQVDIKFSEAETRLEKAMLYRQWITGDLFDGDSDAVREVTAEFQGFAQLQLRKLLGIEAEKQDVIIKTDFTEQETLVLKTLANQILNNPKLTPKKPTGAVTTQLKPAVVTPPAKPVPPKKPQLRTRKVPQEIATQPSELIKQVAKPTVPAPKPVVQQQKPVPAKPQATSQVPPSKKTVVRAQDEIFEENGRTYKVAWVPMAAGEYGPVEKQRVDSMRPETAITLRNGIQVVKTIDGETFKVVNQDQTPRKPVENAVPFPTNGQMAYLTMMQAGQQADKAMKQLDATAAGKGTELNQGTSFLV